ncbi:MAG: Flp family type IVb pilin [Firmicutes bacterium]|nr:Flp family type IVb pilin [Bacillota bacterium]
MLRYLAQLMADRRGQALVEYVLILALVALAALVAFNTLGNSVSSQISNIATHVQNP